MTPNEALKEIWSEWFQFYQKHFREGEGNPISAADQMAFYKIAQPILNQLATPPASGSPAVPFSPQCRHGCETAVGLYQLPQGCPCFDDREQWLCEQHLVKLRNNGYEAVAIFERPNVVQGLPGQMRELIERLRKAAIIGATGDDFMSLEQIRKACAEAADTLAAQPRPSDDRVREALVRKLNEMMGASRELMSRAQITGDKLASNWNGGFWNACAQILDVLQSPATSGEGGR